MGLPGRIPGTFGGGDTGSDPSPAVPFAQPDNPFPVPITANTNYGRDIATDDRSMPVDVFPGEEYAIPGTFEGVGQDLWGYMKGKK